MPAPDDQLQFIDYRKPKLEAGDYQFTSSHRFSHGSDSKSTTDTLNLRVTGERVEVAKSDIFACYPPPNEHGNFSDTLAHISFRKGTLPWIRSAYKKDDESKTYKGELFESWLYLMQLNDQDILDGLAKGVRDCSLREIDKGAFFPLEQKKSLLSDSSVNHLDSVKTVDIKKSLFLKLLLPELEESDKGKDQLESLAHIRRRWTPDASPVSITNEDIDLFNSGNITASETLKLPQSAQRVEVLASGRSWLLPDSLGGDLLIDVISTHDNGALVQKMKLKRELSVLLSNRFGQCSRAKPSDPLKNTACVVSLEQYLNADVINSILALSDDSWMRFIVLTSWDFFSKPEKINFEERVKRLDVNGLKLDDSYIESNPSLASRLQAGFVAMEHDFRHGGRSVSWYRGPFSPAPLDNLDNLDKVVLSDKEMGRDGDTYAASDADKLLHYYAEDGMFDISCSSAYELGRLLGLKDTDFSETLGLYKRNRSRHIKLALSDEDRKKVVANKGFDVNTLPYAKIDDSELRQQYEVIQKWVNQFSDLLSVPTRYLLPDEKLLTERSLRLFHIDGKWIQSLIYGAISLHGRPKVTYELFHEVYSSLAPKLPRQGALLRSDVVWAYPKMLTQFRNIQSNSTNEYLDLINLRTELSDEYTDHIESFSEIAIQHKRLLADDCLLYLTEKKFDYVSLALEPESLHYGADVETNGNIKQYKKAIKFRGQTLIEAFPLPMSDAELGVVNMLKVRRDLLSAFPSAKASMIEKISDSTRDMAAEADPVRKLSLQNSITNLQSYLESVEQYIDVTNDFSSAKLGRFMLEGEPQAEFTVGVEVGEK